MIWVKLPNVQNSIWLIGHGGHANSIVSVLQGLGHEPGSLSFISPNRHEAVQGDLLEETVLGVSALANVGMHVICAFVGSDLGFRKQRVLDYERSGYKVIGFVSRTARIASNSNIDPSCQIFDGCHVGPNSILGMHTVVNTSAVIEHDCIVGDFSHVSVGVILLGGVSVGREVMIGAGTTILPGVKVGDRAVIGAGSVVTKDVAAATKVFGSPAKSHFSSELP